MLKFIINNLSKELLSEISQKRFLTNLAFDIFVDNSISKNIISRSEPLSDKQDSLNGIKNEKFSSQGSYLIKQMAKYILFSILQVVLRIL